MTATPKNPQTIRQRKQTFVNADGTTTKDIYQASSNNSFITRFMLMNDDGTGRYMKFFLTVNGTDVPLGAVFVSSGSGTAVGNSPTNAMVFYLFNHCIYDHNANPIIDLGVDSTPTAVTLRAAMDTAVTAAKTFYVLITAHEF